MVVPVVLFSQFGSIENTVVDGSNGMHIFSTLLETLIFPTSVKIEENIHASQVNINILVFSKNVPLIWQ